MCRVLLSLYKYEALCRVLPVLLSQDDAVYPGSSSLFQDEAVFMLLPVLSVNDAVCRDSLALSD